MGFLNYQAKRQVLVCTKGHPFARDAFAAVFEQLDDIQASFVEQPAAQVFFRPELAAPYEAFVLYDMPGLDFRAVNGPAYVQPPASFKHDFLQLLELGQGFVFLHHAIASWPGWGEYAEIVGGRFLYKPDQVRGVQYPDSGYRHDVEHQVSVVLDHPVTEGVAGQFGITDELYLAHAFTDSIIPILLSHYHFVDQNFYSAHAAVKGQLYSREDWHHSPGHNVIGWVKNYRNSPIVYLQCGDSEAAYGNPNFQRLLSNAINWVASDEAKAWARQRYALAVDDFPPGPVRG